MSFPRLDSHGLTTLVTRLASDIKQGHTILNNSGTAMTQRSKLKFRGVTVTDDATNDTTIVTLSNFNAFVDITTTDEELFGLSINVKKDGVSVDTTEFDNSGFVEYTVLSAGTYVFECTYDGHTYSSANVVIVAQTTYETSISMGLSLEAWITAGSVTGHTLNPSSYADFAALEADEAAVRQLMTVHDAVDYLATASAGDSLMQSVINSDICAKWINISDYAYNTLSANSDIADEMDTADKYGYGEWVENNGTWGAKGNVPIMTANNAPYGNVTPSTTYVTQYGWYAFDGNDNTEWVANGDSSPSMTYEFVNPIQPKKFKLRTRKVSGGQTYMDSVILYGSNDGSAFEPLTDSLDASSATAGTYEKEFNVSHEGYYKYLKLGITGGTNPSLYSLQFYGRELTPLVPTMTGNTTPKGECISSGDSMQGSGNDFPRYYAFDNNSATFWLSDATSVPDTYIGYKFTQKNRVCGIGFVEDTAYNYDRMSTFIVEGSDTGDANDWHDISGTLTVATGSANKLNVYTFNGDVYKYVRAYAVTGSASYRNSIVSMQFYGSDYSEKEFAPGSTMKYIYDHGVAPNGAITGGTKNPDCLTLSAVGTATVTIDKGTRTYMSGKAGLHASGTNRLKCGSGYSVFTASNMPDSNGFDISSISGSVAVGIEQTASGTFDCTEIWIE